MLAPFMEAMHSDPVYCKQYLRAVQSQETLLRKTPCTLGHVYLLFSQASVSPATLGAMLEALSKTPTLLIKERKGKPTAKGYLYLSV